MVVMPRITLAYSGFHACVLAPEQPRKFYSESSLAPASLKPFFCLWLLAYVSSSLTEWQGYVFDSLISCWFRCDLLPKHTHSHTHLRINGTYAHTRTHTLTPCPCSESAGRTRASSAPYVTDASERSPDTSLTLTGTQRI